MTQEHPITPPPELVQQWARYQGFDSPEVLWRTIATEAARWGADQELEACCEWLDDTDVDDSQEAAKKLHAARRPEPEPERVTDEELDELFTEIDQSGEPQSWRAYARAVLARWGK